MPLTHFENWDGVTAPALPANWNAQGGIVTTTTGETPITSPNMIVLADTGQFFTVTYGVLDGNGGNVEILGTGCFSGGINNADFSIFARSGDATTSYLTSTFYDFNFSGSNQQFAIRKWALGTPTTLFSVGLAVAPSANIFYQITGSIFNSTLSATVSRLSDGNNLNMTTGAFGAIGTTATATDSSITGQGYAGWAASTATPLIYGDDWEIFPYGGAPLDPIGIASNTGMCAMSQP